MEKLPTVSIVIPTYNSEKTLKPCLDSIRDQQYPKENIEIIIVDAESVDRTVKIARDYTNNIYLNPLKTGEAGKAIGVKKAKSEIIALIDSDNILEDNRWLSRMVEPFKDESISGSEPLYYTYRKEDGFITRYCALIGMNDPLCLFIGNYDRYSYLTGRWTEVDIKIENHKNYLKVKLDPKNLPTMGANGFLLRRNLLEKCSIRGYLFDVDVVYELTSKGHNKFAKVKIGIVHVFSESVAVFINKQRRRIKHYLFYKKLGVRKYPWNSTSKLKILKFVGYTFLTLPLVFQGVKGWFRKKDSAWFFHIFACWITLFVYSYETVKNK